MNKVMGRSVILAGAVLFMGSPAMAAVTSGLIGDCVDCHTMHNSEQGSPVAIVDGAVSATPIANLLRMDCIACHADPNATTSVVNFGGGSKVPQVNHTALGDNLAGGNFAYIDSAANNRKGHNVAALVGTDDNGMEGFEMNTPPGMYNTNGHKTGARFEMDGGFLANFTCAGSAGCHGIRNQAVATWVNNENTTSLENGNVSGEDGKDFMEMGYVRLTGIPALSGAHHNSYDGEKDVALKTASADVDGQYIADSYRFIPGLKGAGNVTSDANRWKNVSDVSHNEYYGSQPATQISSCGNCHDGEETNEVASHLATDGFLTVPNQSITGFCSTCHGQFHSVGQDKAGGNGTSGAFLRHPADYVIPDSGEYSDYTEYALTAPVARPDITGLGEGGSSVVTPGDDLVMCLSCHMAHASAYDGMLRFDYDLMTAGNADAADDGTGCLACHTTKGVLPQAR